MTLRFKNRLVLLALLFLLASPAISRAQDSLGFSVSPTIFDMSASPGQRFETTIRVINANPYDLTLYIDQVNFVPQEESGVPRFIPIDSSPETQATFAEWIETQEVVQIPAEKTLEVPIRIIVPNDADPGGHFAAIMIGTRPSAENGDTQVSTSQVISSLLFLSVTGEVSELAAIRSFRTTDYIVGKPETTLELRLQNDGNVHLKPQGRITIYNMWGQERGQIAVNQHSLFGNVLPQSIRKYSFDWRTDWSIADIGRYKAKVVLSYGNDTKRSLVSETAFWVLPLKEVFASLFVLGLFVYGFVAALKAYIRRTLLLSGITPGISGSSAKLTKRKSFNFIAPLETGMLDLRSEFKNTHSAKDWSIAAFRFLQKYRTFVLFVIGFFVFVWLVFWYAGIGLEEREYFVIDEYGEVQTEKEKPSPVTFVEPTKAPVLVINRSGASLLDTHTSKIEEAGYYVTLEEGDTVQERTVIVFSPSRTDEALKLSSLLNNAPLSALPETTESDPELTVFFGKDILER